MYHARIEASTYAINVSEILLIDVKANGQPRHRIVVLGYILDIVIIFFRLAFLWEYLIVERVIGGYL